MTQVDGNASAEYSYFYNDLGQLEAIQYGAVRSPLEITYAYDANGNLIEKMDAAIMWTYTWDVQDRLVRATKSSRVERICEFHRS